MIREYDPDTIYEEARQRLLDARNEGAEAAKKQLPLHVNPYFGFEPEHQQWVEGWMEALGFLPRRVL